jgi:hypothetical protein
MLHQISMLAVGAMVALSIFFVFRPHQPLNGIQPPLGTLVATECAAYPETGAIPPEYGCEKSDPPQATAGEPDDSSARP